MPRSIGMTGSKWFTCEMCAFDYPIAFMRRQNGRQVCTYLPCFDTIDISPPLLSDPQESDFEVDLEVINDGF